jgi:tRNA dimethylallyltransferase
MDPATSEPDPADRTPTLILTGSTASGKNRIGASLAARFGGEVISLDSMKVYRGMDVGTAKPTESERRGVPHHLIDVLDPREGMNLRRFVDAAHAARRDVARRGATPTVVGGTQLYLHGFLNGVFAGPDQDPVFRAALRAEAAERGTAALHERLRATDAAAADRIHANDYKRIERALEVAQVAGRPLTELQREGTVATPFARRLYVLTWERTALDRRIDARVLEMFREGFIDEVRRIVAAGGFGRESGEALGYPEAVAVLEGRLSEPAAIERIQAKTRRFARKQATWLKKMPADLRFELRDPADAAAAEETMAADFAAYQRSPLKGSSQS